MTFTIWLGRLGIIFDFLAFLFATPELLGEKRIIRLEIATKKFLNRYLGYPLWRRRVVTSAVIIIVFLLLLIWTSYINQEKILFGFAIVVWIGSFCFLVITEYNKGSEWLKKWSSDLDIDVATSKSKEEEPEDIYHLLAVIMLLFPPLTVIELFMEKGFLIAGKKLLPVLAKDKGLRRRTLYAAAILFAIGIILQLLGTF